MFPWATSNRMYIAPFREWREIQNGFKKCNNIIILYIHRKYICTALYTTELSRLEVVHTVAGLVESLLELCTGVTFTPDDFCGNPLSFVMADSIAAVHSFFSSSDVAINTPRWTPTTECCSTANKRCWFLVCDM